MHGENFCPHVIIIISRTRRIKEVVGVETSLVSLAQNCIMWVGCTSAVVHDYDVTECFWFSWLLE
jgi:hypothetical protein